MKKTSHQQFEMLTTYMEQHGDLSKPTTNARGRLETLKHWDELTTLLNSDASGDTKTTEKWKKVWSDFKNNTKKKAARLHRAASGTGGGPAVFSKLSDLEQRVLNLIGVQVATGLALEEAGFSQDVQIEPICLVESQVNTQVEDSVEDWNQPGPSNRPHVVPLSPLTIPQTQGNDVNIEGGQNVTRTPSMQPETVSTVQPALSGQTETLGSPRRNSPRVRGSPRGLRRGSPLRSRRRSPRRLIRPARSEEAAQHFLNSDREWREFRMQQHHDYMDIRREQNRIRELEVETQRDWRALASRTLDILERFVSNYRRD